MNKKSLLLFICIVFTPFSNGWSILPPYYNESCNDTLIKTIQLFRTGWDLSTPVIFFKEGETLSLEFDDLNLSTSEFGYYINNCTYNWQESFARENEYIDGYNNILLYNRQSSVNTTHQFIHFSATLPNDEIKILKSGNYLLTIFRNNDPENIVFTRKFCLVERLVEINGWVYKADKEHQELKLSIDLGNLHITNPLGEIKVIVIKNYNWNDEIKISAPPMLRENKLVYDLPYQVITDGANEYRYVDLKSTKYISDRVEDIQYKLPFFHFYLKADESSQYKPYFTSKDLNGRYYIDVNDDHNRYLDADYVYVHFKLNAEIPFGSEVYIDGALTQYETNPGNYMFYNREIQAYERTLLLKQGYYNYRYLLKDYNRTEVYTDLTEGSFAETENDFQVFVYLSQPGAEFDRLIGYTIINSSNGASTNKK